MSELHPYEPGRVVTFKDFLPFVHVEGEEIQHKEKFLCFLSDLFDVSANVWGPGDCYACEYLEGKANDLAQNKYSDIHIEPKAFAGDGHFWLTAKSEGLEKELIIDPFGVPTPGKDYYRNKRTIIPFFGTIENAKPFSRRIYSIGEPLGSRGYHIFHP